MAERNLGDGGGIFPIRNSAGVRPALPPVPHTYATVYLSY